MSDEKTKLQKLRDIINIAEFNIIFKDNEEFAELEITIDGHCIKPYERNRKSFGGHMYDPLSTYKTEIGKKLKPLIKEHLDEPLKGYCFVEMEIYFRMPKDFSKKKVKAGLDGILRPTIKKDNDNIEKTTFDLFNKLVYEDDGQILENYTKKYYALEEKTIIKFKIYKNELIIKGR